jgi:DNA-binding transcriptional LysR family regulator
MAPPRIPPIHCLLSFEALARLRSVTLAADELDVTPSAVSHRMRQLESQLGVRLFVRNDFTLSDEVVPVCSPEYLNVAGSFDGFDAIERVTHARLIRSPLESWNTWFRACGIALPEPRAGAQFNDLGLMLDAAAAGGCGCRRAR